MSDYEVTASPATEQKSRLRKTAFMLGLIGIGMFGFGFAMVPLYKLVCSVTGINSIITNNSGRTAVADFESEQVSERLITVQFDATINGNASFEFRPMTKTVDIHPGEVVEVSYFIKNNTDHDVITQSVSGVTPWQATEHVKKMECFCFSQQPLAAGESKEMGLSFSISRDLPGEYDTITLSYTLMDTDRSKVFEKNEGEIQHDHSHENGHEHHHTVNTIKPAS